MVDFQDRHLQTIYYQATQSDQLTSYQLSTVTYGTKTAPFLATRCLLELVSSAPSQVSQRAIHDDFYVDDLLSDGESIDECLQLYKEVADT